MATNGSWRTEDSAQQATAEDRAGQLAFFDTLALFVESVYMIMSIDIESDI